MDTEMPVSLHVEILLDYAIADNTVCEAERVGLDGSHPQVTEY
jgi:hypothetical protein